MFSACGKMHPNLSFWGQKMIFFWGGEVPNPLHHTSLPSTPTVHRSPLYWNPKYATALDLYQLLSAGLPRGGVAGASVLGPGVLRGPLKKLSWCGKRWKRAGRNGEVKNCSSDTPPVAQWDQRPARCCWMSKVADRTKIRRKQRNKIILKGFSSELYPCIVLWFWTLAKFVSTPHWK